MQRQVAAPGRTPPDRGEVLATNYRTAQVKASATVEVRIQVRLRGSLNFVLSAGYIGWVGVLRIQPLRTQVGAKCGSPSVGSATAPAGMRMMR